MKMHRNDRGNPQIRVKKTGKLTEGGMNWVISDDNFDVWVLAGALFRFGLYMAGWSAILSDRIELVTPITSIKRAEEGLYLAQANLSPYSGDTVHQSPLVLAVVWIASMLRGEAGVAVLCIALDCLLAYGLVYTWRLHAQWLTLKDDDANRKAPPVIKSVDSYSAHLPTLVAVLYLLSPYTVLTCVSLSSAPVLYLAVLASFAFALRASYNLSTLILALATCVSHYSIVLLPAITLILISEQSSKLGGGRQRQPAVVPVVLYACWLFALLYISSLLSQSWDFVPASFYFTMTAADLTPNIGLYWYFFLEIFEQFRVLFLCVFNLQLLLCVVPVTIRFSHQPTLVFTATVSFVAVLKSYPSVADTVFALWFATLWPHLLPYMRFPFVICCMYIATAYLGPVFYNQWIFAGSGNANFFYAITLIHNTAGVLSIVDIIAAYCRRDFDVMMGITGSSEKHTVQLL